MDTMSNNIWLHRAHIELLGRESYREVLELNWNSGMCDLCHSLR